MKFPFSYSLKYLQNSIYAVYTFLPHLLRKSSQPQKRQILRSPPCFGVFANFKVLKICIISITNSRISTNYTLIFKQFTFFQQTLYYTREHWTMPFAPPALRAVLRRQRQRDATLWTPIPRCCGECVRLSPLMRAASFRQQDGGTKGWQISLSVSIYKLGKYYR